MQKYDYDKIKKQMVENLKNVYDPEIPVNIYDLGLIYDLILKEREDGLLKCTVSMTLTSPACPVAESLVENVKYQVSSVDDVEEAKVELTFNPPWDKSKMSEEGIDLMMMNGASI